MCINAADQATREALLSGNLIRTAAVFGARGGFMTQHFLEEHTREDQRAMRNLATVVGVFMVATAVLAITIAAIAG